MILSLKGVMVMHDIPAVWQGYGVGRRIAGAICWDRVDADPRWLRLFVTDTETVVTLIRITPLDTTVEDAWWGAWDLAKERWAFVAPSRTALRAYFAYELSHYTKNYAFVPIRIEEMDASTDTG